MLGAGREFKELPEVKKNIKSIKELDEDNKTGWESTEPDAGAAVVIRSSKETESDKKNRRKKMEEEGRCLDLGSYIRMHRDKILDRSQVSAYYSDSEITSSLPESRSYCIEEIEPAEEEENQAPNGILYYIGDDGNYYQVELRGKLIDDIYIKGIGLMTSDKERSERKNKLDWGAVSRYLQDRYFTKLSGKEEENFLALRNFTKEVVDKDLKEAPEEREKEKMKVPKSIKRIIRRGFVDDSNVAVIIGKGTPTESDMKDEKSELVTEEGSDYQPGDDGYFQVKPGKENEPIEGKRRGIETRYLAEDVSDAIEKYSKLVISADELQPLLEERRIKEKKRNSYYIVQAFDRRDSSSERGDLFYFDQEGNLHEVPLLASRIKDESVKAEKGEDSRWHREISWKKVIEYLGKKGYTLIDDRERDKIKNIVINEEVKAQEKFDKSTEIF